MKRLFFLLCVSMAALFAKATDSTSVALQLGAGYKTANVAVVDSTNGSVITGATVTNFSITNAHPEVATVTYQFLSGGVYSVKITPVAQGSGTATITCLVSYTDPGDGLQKNENKTIIISYNVVYTPPHGARLSMTFN